MAAAPPTAGSEFGAFSVGASAFTDVLGDLFGRTDTTKVSRTGERDVRITERLEIEEAGVQKIIQDILGSEQGLASIFSEEQVSGIFSSTVGKQAAGDLLANLAGEIAKLTAVRVREEKITETAQEKSEKKEKGLVEQIGDFLGF